MPLILRNTIRGGRAAGLANVAGLAVGITVWSTATIVGLTAVLLAFSPLYSFIRSAGAVYLMLLGTVLVAFGLRVATERG